MSKHPNYTFTFCPVIRLIVYSLFERVHNQNVIVELCPRYITKLIFLTTYERYFKEHNNLIKNPMYSYSNNKYTVN